MAANCKFQAQALKKLEDQLTCAICLDAFKDPKLLQCFHVYCKECLERLVVKDQQGQVSVRCPTCRRSTLLPQTTTVADLQTAFHIHHLFEIQDAFEKVKEPQKVQCGKCTKVASTATSYCRDCREFICSTCADIHSRWDMFSDHEVVALSEFEKKVKQLDALKKVTLYCSLHKGKELELYCETCEELICLMCTVLKHNDHHCVLVSDAFERQKAEITASLVPVETQLETINKAIGKIDTRSKAVEANREAVEAEIHKKINELHDVLELRRAELICELNEKAQKRLKKLATQKDEVETIQTQLASCLTFVRESLRTGSKGEVLKMKKGVLRQIKEITASIKPDQLPPCEPPDMMFSMSPELTQTCRKLGNICGSDPSQGKKGSPFPVTVKLPVHTPVRTIDRVSQPWGVTVNQQGEMVVAECGRDCVSIFASSGEKIRSFGSQDSSHGQFTYPCGVAIDDDGNILVMDNSNHCIKKFSAEGRFLAAVGTQGSGQLQFFNPVGIKINPQTKRIYVADQSNHRVQVLNPDLTFFSSFGTKGNGPGQLYYPMDVSFDSDNNVYVTDRNNNRIQVFTETGEFSRQIGRRGSGKGELNGPAMIAIDCEDKVYVTESGNHRVSVFTSDGGYLTSFGRRGNGPQQFQNPYGITVDKSGIVYVCDYGNNRVQIF